MQKIHVALFAFVAASPIQLAHAGEPFSVVLPSLNKKSLDKPIWERIGRWAHSRCTTHKACYAEFQSDSKNGGWVGAFTVATQAGTVSLLRELDATDSKVPSTGFLFVRAKSTKPTKAQTEDTFFELVLKSSGKMLPISVFKMTMATKFTENCVEDGPDIVCAYTTKVLEERCNDENLIGCRSLLGVPEARALVVKRFRACPKDVELSLCSYTYDALLRIDLDGRQPSHLASRFAYVVNGQQKVVQSIGNDKSLASVEQPAENSPYVRLLLNGNIKGQIFKVKSGLTKSMVFEFATVIDNQSGKKLGGANLVVQSRNYSPNPGPIVVDLDDNGPSPPAVPSWPELKPDGWNESLGGGFTNQTVDAGKSSSLTVYHSAEFGYDYGRECWMRPCIYVRVEHAQSSSNSEPSLFSESWGKCIEPKTICANKDANLSKMCENFNSDKPPCVDG